MDRSRVTAPSARVDPRSSAGASAALVPAHSASVGDLGFDPVALAIVIGVIVLAAGSILVLHERSEDDSEPADYEGPTGDRSGAVRGDVGGPSGVDDRDRVREILRANGGRARQTVIVDETGWSKAKVSSVLAEMDEEDEVAKLRVGRENLVSLPGHEPDAVDSPLED